MGDDEEAWLDGLMPPPMFDLLLWKANHILRKYLWKSFRILLNVSNF